MKNLIRRLLAGFGSRRAQGLVEYALILLLVVVVLVTALTLIGERTRVPFENMTNQLQNAT